MKTYTVTEKLGKEIIAGDIVWDDEIMKWVMMCEGTEITERNYEAIYLVRTSIPQQDKWIRIEDEKPEPYRVVICHIKSQNASCSGHISEDSEGNKKWITHSQGIVNKVTHWQPLPTNPIN